ncbi:ABC transporter permease [Gilliamella sp. Choc4-2]|uniref:ABC transporter permease n=1 Tax=unclassified Gilliamella TaxID=2685620 RepID=UPI0004DCEA0E|nr:ABC transporter permease [Gilliamella apicola]KFA58374.1 ABC-type multidrug transport system, permease component [Gilliamella apicola]OCG31017.1 ABC transporter permease [Gilliamella apicola]OCG46585.1 ABC transporter permease [Gilliamella apicola]OCG55868.1 ABC transporter permease [Gilliamella apicola]OCG64753.1 ABC transporter permease [Gilliamella apicola]
MLKMFWSSFLKIFFLMLMRPIWLLLLLSVSLMSLVYINGTITNLPVAIVDQDHTPTSRGLIRSLETSSKIGTIIYESSLQAYDDINNRKLFAVITIPRDFEKRLLSGEEVTIPAYGDASSRLANGLIQVDIKGIYQQILTQYNTRIMRNSGFSDEQIKIILSPIKAQTEPLYNAGISFAAITFPGLLVMLLQHSFLIASTRINITLNSLPQGRPPKIVILGSLCGLLPIWLFLSIVLFGLWPWVLGYRQLAGIIEILTMTFPLLLGALGLSKLLTECLRRTEMIYLTLAFLTTPVFYLSGTIWPIDAMPHWVQFVTYLLPSTWATNMIAGVNQMGLGLSDNLYNIFMILLLGIIYSALGLFISALREGRARRLFKKENYMKKTIDKL